MSMMVSFCAVLFPTRCLGGEILNLIESVSEGIPSYSCTFAIRLGSLIVCYGLSLNPNTV